MDKKKPFVLRLNPEMMKRLEKWASDEFRSINGQIEWILHQALKESGRLKKTEKDEQNEEPEQ
ncbi:MAG: Arc family DNA-binding protein [Bacteroidales bacterium]